MNILFLSNNYDVVKDLYIWLCNYEDNVIYKNEPINSMYIKEKNIDFIVSYNYLHLIKQDVIELLPHRIINLHISLLPWNRGAIPNIWSFIEGTPTGVTIHEINPGLDTGDIIIQKAIIFDYSKETLKSSYEKSHTLIQKLFIKNWDKIKNGIITPKPQNGTIHYKKDSMPFDHIIDYNDTIEIFLEKYKKACK